MVFIKGAGNGRSASVTADNRLSVDSRSRSLESFISTVSGQYYQVIGEFASVNNSTHTILHIKNTSTLNNLIISFVRLQTVDLAGGTTLPSVNTYWELGSGRTVSSGGSTETAVNMNRTSANTADAVLTDNNPTMAGTFNATDKHYVTSEAESVLIDKSNALILGQNDTYEVRITSDHTSGIALAQMQFYFDSASTRP